MAVTAVNGGLIPWQSGNCNIHWKISICAWERSRRFIFLEEQKTADALFNYSPDENGDSRYRLYSYRSTQIEFPILEYRPFRSFGVDQRSSLFIQLYGGVDIPHNVELLKRYKYKSNTPELKTCLVSSALRLIFDWRHYF